MLFRVRVPESQCINSYSIFSKRVAQYSPLSKHSGRKSLRGWYFFTLLSAAFQAPPKPGVVFLTPISTVTVKQIQLSWEVRLCSLSTSWCTHQTWKKKSKRMWVDDRKGAVGYFCYIRCTDRQKSMQGKIQTMRNFCPFYWVLVYFQFFLSVKCSWLITGSYVSLHFAQINSLTRNELTFSHMLSFTARPMCKMSLNAFLNICLYHFWVCWRRFCVRVFSKYCARVAERFV